MYNWIHKNIQADPQGAYDEAVSVANQNADPNVREEAQTRTLMALNLTISQGKQELEQLKQQIQQTPGMFQPSNALPAGSLTGLPNSQYTLPALPAGNNQNEQNEDEQ